MFNLLDSLVGQGLLPENEHGGGLSLIHETGSSRKTEIEMKLDFKDLTNNGKEKSRKLMFELEISKSKLSNRQ
jgi:hypothetical protein